MSGTHFLSGLKRRSLLGARFMKLVEPATEDVQYASTLINAKAAPILAAAMSAKVDWLLSMDKHFLTGDFTRKLRFAIGKPGDFLVQLGDKE